MITIDPQWIDAGTLALQVNLYGEDLGRAATGDAYDDEEAYHREQVTDILTAVVPLITADRKRRAGELRERLMDLVGDFEQATIAMTSAALETQTTSQEVVDAHRRDQRAIRTEILRLSGELANCA